MPKLSKSVAKRLSIQQRGKRVDKVDGVICDDWFEQIKSELVWVGDCDNDPDQSGLVDKKTGRKPLKI